MICSLKTPPALNFPRVVAAHRSSSLCISSLPSRLHSWVAENEPKKNQIDFSSIFIQSKRLIRPFAPFYCISDILSSGYVISFQRTPHERKREPKKNENPERSFCCCSVEWRRKVNEHQKERDHEFHDSIFTCLLFVVVIFISICMDCTTAAQCSTV